MNWISAVTSVMPVRLFTPSGKEIGKLRMEFRLISARLMLPMDRVSPSRSRAASLPDTRMVSLLRVMVVFWAVAPPPSVRA